MAVDWEAVARELVHPTAVRVIELCDQQSRSPNQMSKLMPEALGSISYHVRQLADKGLLILVHTEPRRGALEHYYRTSPSVSKRRKTRAKPAPVGDDSADEMQVVAHAA